jgi:hypothetical protein
MYFTSLLGGEEMGELELVFNHIMHSVAPEKYPKEKHLYIQYQETTSLKELLIIADEPYADFSYYYNLSKDYSFNRQFLPFILRTNGKVAWSLKYGEVYVEEFPRTHNIKSQVLHAYTGIPQAGGIGLKEISELWACYYPILDQMVTVYGAFSGVKSIGDSIKGMFKHNTPPPAIYDFILSRDRWNHNELAEIAEIDKENAKLLLRTFGFIWDSSSRQYLKGPNTEEIIEKLSSVSCHSD